MKARVKETGEIVEVVRITDRFILKDHPQGIAFNEDELDLCVDAEPDYWTRLKHQYAGMAMQGIMTNPIGFENLRARGTNIQIETALLASEFAHALVEKMKEERK